MKIVIAIDDLHPEQGWGSEGDESVGYLEELNKEFGCKFTLFIPSNYHHKYPLSKHKTWARYWKTKKWIEMAAHGHFHECKQDSIGECEFLELDTEAKAKTRITKCLKEWEAIKVTPTGWRNPGWLTHPSTVPILEKCFDYVALHHEHNNSLQWDCKMIFGEDGIHSTDSINIWRGNSFIFQSHIAGDWNDNCWTNQNYANMRQILMHFENNYEIEYKTFKELE